MHTTPKPSLNNKQPGRLFLLAFCTPVIAVSSTMQKLTAHKGTHRPTRQIESCCGRIAWITGLMRLWRFTHKNPFPRHFQASKQTRMPAYKALVVIAGMHKSCYRYGRWKIRGLFPRPGDARGAHTKDTARRYWGLSHFLPLVRVVVGKGSGCCWHAKPGYGETTLVI